MRVFDAPYIKPFTPVQSAFKAKWVGYVLWCTVPLGNKKLHIAQCLITHDKNGNPLWKPKKSLVLSTYWLLPLDAQNARYEEIVVRAAEHKVKFSL